MQRQKLVLMSKAYSINKMGILVLLRPSYRRGYCWPAKMVIQQFSVAISSENMGCVIAEGSRSYGSTIPLVIMTSDHTHKRIEELLSNNNHFGVLPDQIQLLKQVNMFSLTLTSLLKLIWDVSQQRTFFRS